MNCFFVFLVCVGKKLTAQILIGTPKELSAYRLLGHFDPKDIDLVVIKDPDAITSTQLVKNNILDSVKNAQIIFFATTRPNRKCLENINIHESFYLPSLTEISPNVKHLFIECANFAEKVSALKEIINATDDQMIVFCQVILSNTYLISFRLLNELRKFCDLFG